jgi:hypothetical protein
MGIWDKVIQSFAARVATNLYDLGAVQPMIEARAYRSGYYKPQLKVKGNQFDDNIGINLIGLLVNRVVSQMLGNGFSLDFGGEGDTKSANEDYVNAVLEANKQEVLFHRAATAASEAGTGYLLLIPDGIAGEDGKIYPRLQLIDPAFVKIDPLPEDYEVVVRYTITYTFTDVDGKEKARRKTIEHNAPEVLEDGTQQGGNTWTVTDEIQQPGGRWEQVGRVVWAYDFAPLLHWQNLPSATDVHGEPDVTPAQIALQDRINFVSSNISKLIRYYAHPMRFGINIGELKEVDSGPDKMLRITGTDADIRQLEALGDLTASMAYLTLLRQAFFACGRVVDIDSVQDKTGQLTNFGLRVLYQDNTNLIATHRELFGDMLEELARRLQMLQFGAALPCSVVWPEFLPVDEVAMQTALKGDLEMGLVSKQTASGKRAYDWEQEQQRIEDEKASEDNIGAALLRGFTQGGGGFNPNNQNTNPNGRNNND